MYGKDKNLWFVDKDPEQNKIWSKYNLDFDKLPDDCYNDAYLPIVKKINDETGLENKFGGNIPFFIEGESWPLDEDGNPMTFCCQFRDPRKNDNRLYRVFLPFDAEYQDFNYDYHISLIEMTESILKKQIIIKKPNNYGKDYDCFEIDKWRILKELKAISFIKKRLSILDDEDDYSNNELFENLYYDHSLVPTFETKVGGTPVYCQYVKTEMQHIIQLVESEFIPYSIGDSGIIHINENCEVYYDCH